MSESNLEKELKKFDKDLEALKAKCKEIEATTDKNEDKKFQIDLLEVEQGVNIFSSIFSVISSIMVAVITTTITIAIGFSNVIGVDLTLPIIYEVAVAVFASLLSWFIFIKFRNRALDKLRKKLDDKSKESKPSLPKP